MTNRVKIIEITTCIGCVNRCKYCPQDLLLSKYKGVKSLTLDKFNELLTHIPKDVIINFAGFVEPFQNQECVDMILSADEKGYTMKLFTTLVGLSEKDAKRLKDVKFERCLVHQLDGKPIRQYPFITERWNEEKLAPTITSRAGNLWPVERKDEFKKCLAQGNCSDAVVLPNGDMYCCMDYGLTHNMGNLFKMNYEDIKPLGNFELCHTCEYSQR
jgi:sulfatase maturation enzyme AslB (radical SAM superfamily)